MKMNIKRKTKNNYTAKFNQPLNIRVSRDILDVVREAALLAQIPLSSWMRDRMSRAARRELRVAGHFPKLPKQIHGSHPPSPRKELPMPVVVEVPDQQALKWIARLRKEFLIVGTNAVTRRHYWDPTRGRMPTLS